MAKRVLHDRYFRQAKREGYLARSAYKLIELDQRRRIFRDGDRVLDLGCAPGSWLQVACERVGRNGYVAGIDLLAVSPGVPPEVRTVRGDFTTIDTEELLPPDGMLFDVVLSDMAPNTSGHGDHFRSIRLCHQILDRVGDLLARDGDLVMKVFEGEEMGGLTQRCRSIFRKLSVIKPRATREVSRETFAVAQGYTPHRDRRGRSPDARPGGGPPEPVKGWS